MRPTTIRSGEKLRVQTGLGVKTAFFVRRERARAGVQAQNFLRFPDFVGLDGPGDDGICVMSDYEVSRKVERADARQRGGAA